MSAKRSTSADAGALLAEGAQFIHRELMLVDERRWDEWLELYAPDCVYWMPMWKSEEVLNDDPDGSLSHMYYTSRAGLADRIVRIRSRRSPASTPAARTTHLAANLLALEPPEPGRLRLRSAWTCHVFFTRIREQHVFFGHSEYELRRPGAAQPWTIARKKVVLQNDQIPTLLDIYCV